MIYGKHFASMYTGSMMGAGPVVFAVMGYVIANTSDSEVELNPKLLGFTFGCPAEEVTAAIDYLCSPDPQSRTKTLEGKRLVKTGEYLYEVVNYVPYHSISNEEERREYFRVKKREQRARDKHGPRPSKTVFDKVDSLGQSTMSTHLDLESERDTEKEEEVRNKRLSPPPKPKSNYASRPQSQEEVVDFCANTLALPANDGKALWDHWVGNGFKVNGKPMNSWKHTASNWQRRSMFFPSLQNQNRKFGFA